MTRLTRAFAVLLAFAIGLTVFMLSRPARGAQQFQGLCAFVKIEIAQELTLERIGFLATLEITNNEGDANITAFSAGLTFEDPLTGEDASDQFFVQPANLSGISSIGGTGIIMPGETAVIEWFMIPVISAGGTEPTGKRYNIGAQLAGQIYGQDIDPGILAVIPDTITVLPEAQLDITYFQPRDVDGDDPFTPDVESPIPFTLGVLVNNVGFGPANDVQIVSEQPRIVENEQALILIAQLLGSRVDDEPTDETSLTLDLGTIQPGNCRKGAWDMITSLSGQFIEFNATFTHAPELGGRDTSVITDLNAYFIAHEVLNDQPGRDDLKDFLADTIPDETPEDLRARDIIPDTLFETDCNTLAVNPLTQVQVESYDGTTTVVSAVADFENWVYIRVDDPAQAKFDIESVVRSDGKVLNENNYWTSMRYRFEDNQQLFYLHIFDFVALADYEYTVTYAPAAPDFDPPTTTLRFAGEVTEAAGKFFIAPETQLYFTAVDASPVSIFYRFADDVDFLPAVPFFVTQPGESVIEYYSIDSSGNEEIHQFATVVLSSDFPSVANLTTDTSEVFAAGESVSVRPETVKISFDGANPATTTDATVSIFRGVFGYPTVAGVPSSPTTRGDATINVGGENVDFYRYRLNGGAWSAEFPVAQPIVFSGLSGSNQLDVNGRSGLGDFLPDAEAVTTSWVVDAGADAADPLGPLTPNRSTAASVSVPGSTFFCYRIDGTFYQPEPGGGAPILLSDLEEGLHTVEVLERADAGDPCPGDVPGNAVSWTVDRSYGYDLPDGVKVREEILPDIGAATVDFPWDGRNDSGSVVPPDWYSVRVTLGDALGRKTSAIVLLQVGDLLSGETIVADVPGADQDEPHAVGNWMVWQDQRNGDWDIYSLDLVDGSAVPIQLAASTLNQQRPRTDGVYAVWEDRQPDGTWDIGAKELGTPNPAFSITQTPAFDERRPSIDWPWVVFQRTPVADPTAPAQLVAYNMETDLFTDVDPTTQDQLDPSVHTGRVVWQDLRDAGAGEIYLKDLETGEVTRITSDPGGQIQPAIFDAWIVWADNRAGLQLDLYGFNLARGAEVQITATPQDEARPRINGQWVVYTDDSTGEDNQNLRLLHLSNFAAVQVTNRESPKDKPSVASGRLAWVDGGTGADKIKIGELPDLQPVFDNRNTVAVTAGMLGYQGDAFALLTRWNAEAGVTAITRYTSLVPTPVAETATWNVDSPAGDNFALEAGSFLWIEFDSGEILDLGHTSCGTIDLAAGINAFSFSCHPDHYTAFELFRELGVANVRALRLLDAQSGEWVVAVSPNGGFVGEDFEIPQVAVLLVELNAPLTQWKPGQGVP